MTNLAERNDTSNSDSQLRIPRNINNGITCIDKSSENVIMDSIITYD